MVGDDGMYVSRAKRDTDYETRIMKIKTILLAGCFLSFSLYVVPFSADITHDHLQKEKRKGNLSHGSAASLPLPTQSLYPLTHRFNLAIQSICVKLLFFNLKITSPFPFIIIPKTFFIGWHNSDDRRRDEMNKVK